MSRKGMMIVFNGIENDNRVLKMAAAMRRVYPDFVLIGMKKGRLRDEAAEETSIHGMRCVLFPHRSRTDLVRGARESDLDFAERKRHYGLQRFREEVSAFARQFRPSCIHTHDMFMLPVGHDIKRLSEDEGGWPLTWIHDVHEFVAGCSHIDAHIRNAALDFEREMIADADHVITVTEELKDELESTYSLKRPVMVVFNSPAMRPTTPAPTGRLRSLIGVPRAPIAVYAGNVKPMRGIERMIPVLQRMPDLHFVLLTENRGEFVVALKERASKAAVSGRMHWLPYVAPTQVARFVAEANLGVIPIENYGNAEMSLPNKLFDYVFAGLPVVSHKLRALTTFFERFSLGQVVDFDNPDLVVEAIKATLANQVDNLERFKRDQNEAIKIYAWEGQEAKLVSLYMSVEGIEGQVANPLQDGEKKAGEIRVLHGLFGSAGQPSILADALNRINGISARSFSVFPSKYGYRSDIYYPVLNKKPENMIGAFQSVEKKFDVFHLHGWGFFYNNKNTSFPSGYDILLLRAAGKKVYVHFRGSEVRIQSEFRNLSPYHYVDDDEDLTVSNFPEEEKRKYINFVSAVADGVFVTDPELQSYVPGAKIIERAIDLESWSFVGVSADVERPLVVHAPSRRGVKGTSIILDAVERLKAQGFCFDFRLVEGVSNEEARKVYERADIVIDQLRIGWYGVLAVEAMALGKPVICYIRDDLKHHLGSVPPLVVASPDNIVEVLADLIKDSGRRVDLSYRARSYCEENHDSKKIAEKLFNIYSEPGRCIDTDFVSNIMVRDSRFGINKGINVYKNNDNSINFDMIFLYISKIRQEGFLRATRLAVRKISYIFKLKFYK
ncbi:glycosyltransferase family 4 protein [Nitratireductor rhodophyticola]|uniref:glycosyltransferase family 4 protein n=1 Tax=Nitratireductor rhodophyticola TaxID=2854036 RepID=UPI00300A586F